MELNESQILGRRVSQLQAAGPTSVHSLSHRQATHSGGAVAVLQIHHDADEALPDAERPGHQRNSLLQQIGGANLHRRRSYHVNFMFLPLNEAQTFSTRCGSKSWKFSDDHRAPDQGGFESHSNKH
jgi:hypothetical protein